MNPKQIFTEAVPYRMSGHIRIFPKPQPQAPPKPVFEDKNVIVTTVKSLFARMMINYTGNWEPLYGVWGLALGLGDGIWSDAPGEQATQTRLKNVILKQPLSSAHFVDSAYNPLPTGQYYDPTDVLNSQQSGGVPPSIVRVDFQTEIEATQNGLVGVPIREMGLIGGGTKRRDSSGNTLTTDMVNTSNWWDPTADNPNPDSVTLVNYRTIPPLTLPPDVPFIFSWIIAF